jgi:hypothetical protein
MFEAARFLAFSFIFAFLGIVLVASIFTSCTENQRARKFGGDQTITLLPRQRLDNITWKGDEIWILSHPATNGESAEVHTFDEKSSFGIVEGTITIVEQ